MTVTEVFDANYEKLIRDGYVVLDLFGDHCGPCKAMAPYFDQVAADMAYIRFLKASTDRNSAIAQAFKINAVPTLLFMHNGEIVERHTGALDANQLREHIGNLLYS